MTSFKPPAPLPAANPALPTMYDLPSDDSEDTGLPDQFHHWQPELLSQTFRPATHPLNFVFTAADLNLYYDASNPGYFKRPDWFAVVGVPRIVDRGRLSYVLWQEQQVPMIVVELLSPSTREKGQGQVLRGGQPPSKWEVYESILQVPY
jgi:Uma2 family endonuclease